MSDSESWYDSEDENLHHELDSEWEQKDDEENDPTFEPTQSDLERCSSSEGSSSDDES